MSKNKAWEGFGELNNTPLHQGTQNNEFKEDLPSFSELKNDSLLEATTPRRDFLKYLGFSTAAATLAASCNTPIKNSVPFLNKPDNQIPGIPNFYATTYINGGDAIPAIVKQRDGRPIKIEGNEESSLYGGGTSAQMQASVLDLYDMTRKRHPLALSGTTHKEIPTYVQVDEQISAALNGKKIALLTSTVNSPSSLDIINQFTNKFSGSKHIQYDEISYSGLIQANELAYGKKLIPTYQFDKADVIVSLAADFLGTWLNPVAFSKQYASKRNLKSGLTMSKHIQFESILSMTGANADERFTHRPSETGLIAQAILTSLDGTEPTFADKRLVEGIKQTAKALKDANGKALVVCGSNDVNLQVIVAAINSKVGANGNTINWGATTNTRKGIDSDIEQLVADMESGAIDAIIIHDVNPVFTYRDSKKFAAALKKITSISLTQKADETAEICKFIIPTHHWLESFGDAEPVTGQLSFAQPLINPMFKTRAWQTNLLKWSGDAKDYETYFATYWKGKTSGGYYKLLEKGIQETTIVSGTATFNAGALSTAVTKLVPAITTGAEIFLYEKVTMGRGMQANNPWLQETPDPITKTTWDNYALIGPEMYKSLYGKDVVGVEGDADDYEVHPEKKQVTVTVNNAVLTLPVMVIPGIDLNTIGLAFGYGRKSAVNKDTKENIGIAASEAGFNANIFTGFNTTFTYNSAAKISKTTGEYVLAQNQVRGLVKDNLGYERPVIYQTTLNEYKENPKSVLHHITKEKAGYLAEGHEKDVDGNDGFESEGTQYPTYDRPGIKWGLNIDLNTCTGCSACVVACTAENNVSVVGKSQVAKFHDMHWLRIDRYFTGDAKNPEVVFQPMMCQHCDNAPCENVCPVAATNHSSEGLNQMTYNRCIGTRYCANNCPFKVRRFNWLDYTGADSFPNNQKGVVDEVTFQMVDDLTRMVLNPDVTVRSRGVIEKCSFCVQRLQAVKLDAKKAQDKSLVNNVKTACMQACTTGAITFGNVNAKDSEISKVRKTEDGNRTFYVLEQLHVLPNVSYQVKIKNREEKLNHEEHHGAVDHATTDASHATSSSTHTEAAHH